jgi:hypothetical protein
MEKQNNNPSEEVPKDTVTVDAVHPRFLNKSRQQRTSRLAPSDEVAYCMQCNENIGNTVPAIRNHFLRSPHESQPCVYCSGPVFRYFSRSEKFYHECTLNAAHEEESSDSDTSSLSRDEDSDTSETQSIKSAKNIETTDLLCVQNTDSHGFSDISNVEGT